MIDLNTIQEEVISDINRIILEELTVNDIVLQADEIVKEYILNNIQSRQETMFAKGGGLRKMSFSLKLFNDSLKVNFYVNNYNFKDEIFYKEYIKKKDIDTNCESVYNKIGSRIFCMCYINYVSINFKPLPKFAEDVHHEMNHLYQQFMDGKTYGNSLKMSGINTDLFSEDEKRKDVATVLYLANYQEQDSYVSSVYSYVKHNFHMGVDKWNVDGLLKETDAFQMVCKLKDLYKKIRSHRGVYRDILLVDYNFKRWDRFDKRIKNAIDRFEEKFAMVVKKCKKDFVVYESHSWCEMGNYKKLFLLN